MSFPELDEIIDWEGCAGRNAEYLHTDKLIHSTVYTGYFERLISFVGFENAAIALIDEDGKEAVHRLFERITELYIEFVRRLKKWFDIDILELHDDWGTQRGLTFSAAAHTEMILPYIRRLVDACHDMGVLVEQHSCGKIDELLPNIIASGADTWRGQGDVVDKKLLVDTYGRSFRFGVEIRLNPGAAAEQGLAAVSDFLADYHGKDVWLTPCRAENTPAMDELNRAVFAYAAEKGRI